MLSGTEVGPFHHAPSRILARAILRGVGFIAVRNDDSGEEVRALGVPADRVEVLPDTAFALQRADPVQVSLTAQRLGVVPGGPHWSPWGPTRRRMAWPDSKSAYVPGVGRSLVSMHSARL